MVACRSPKSRGACSSQAIPVTMLLSWLYIRDLRYTT
jgi:hypothetical protein